MGTADEHLENGETFDIDLDVASNRTGQSAITNYDQALIDKRKL